MSNYLSMIFNKRRYANDFQDGEKYEMAATFHIPTKKTPAPVAGGRGRRGRGGRGRNKELPILDHAAVGEHAVEPLTRSPSSSPRLSSHAHALGLSPDDIDLVKC